VLPLVWRGGQALGMLTSHSSLTRTDLSPDQRWSRRFHFTEEEFMMMQDARFERKPYFTIEDIIEDPFAGGISAFGAITDNYFLPFMHGVRTDLENEQISVCVLTVNSLGVMECWTMVFDCNKGRAKTTELMASPKERLEQLTGRELETEIGRMLSQPPTRKRFRLFFNSEYYPALIPVRDSMVLLHKAIEGLIERGALSAKDREIVELTERLAPEWFIGSD
jgi:hypothetical protein